MTVTAAFAATVMTAGFGTAVASGTPGGAWRFDTADPIELPSVVFGPAPRTARRSVVTRLKQFEIIMTFVADITEERHDVSPFLNFIGTSTVPIFCLFSFSFSYRSPASENHP